MYNLASEHETKLSVPPDIKYKSAVIKLWSLLKRYEYNTNVNKSIVIVSRK